MEPISKKNLPNRNHLRDDLVFDVADNFTIATVNILKVLQEHIGKGANKHRNGNYRTDDP